jgi:hypothetical protein
MPLRRLASTAAGDDRKASRERTASGRLDSGAQRRGEGGDDFAAGRHGAEDVDAGQMHQFAVLLEAEFDLTLGDQPAHRDTGRGQHDAWANLLGDAPALEQRGQRHAAGPGRIPDAARRQHGSAQRGFGGNVGPRRAGADRDRHARAHQVGPAAGDHGSGGDQPVDRIGGQRHHVEGLAGLHALGGIDPADRLEIDLDAGLLVVAMDEVRQQLAGRHRRNA